MLRLTLGSHQEIFEVLHIGPGIPFPPVFFCCSGNHDKCDQFLIHSEIVNGGNQLPLLGDSESSDLWTRGLPLSLEGVLMFSVYYSELFSVE